MGKGTSGGDIDVDNISNMPTNRNPGRPNTRYNLITSDGKGPKGQKQSRETDAEGKPSHDTDYNHSDDGTHSFPHEHDWENGAKGPGYVPNEFGGKDYFNK